METVSGFRVQRRRVFPSYYTADDINGLFAKNQDNITTNPLFRAEAADDYRLTQQSPCVDAGTTLIPMLTDFRGEPRLVGPAVDMGCIKFPARGAVLTCR